MISSARFFNISFALTFNAAEYLMNWHDNVDNINEHLQKEQLVPGLGLSLEAESVSYTITDNCGLFYGTSFGSSLLCGEYMECTQIDDDGEVKCSSRCALENKDWWCGESALCSQENVDEQHVCSCSDLVIDLEVFDLQFGNGNDPCAVSTTISTSIGTEAGTTVTADNTRGLESWEITLIAVIPTLFILGECLYPRQDNLVKYPNNYTVLICTVQCSLLFGAGKTSL